MAKYHPLGGGEDDGQVNHCPFLLPWPCHASASTSSSTHVRASTSSSHSEAERRRRERINTHLSTLRRLLPGANKLDKATLLGRVIDHVKDLKRKAFEISKGFIIPTELDEVTVEFDGNVAHCNKERFIIRASFCCDDRPELFAELTRALHGLKLRTIRADIATLGGRVRNVLILCTKEGDEGVSMNTLRESLKSVLGSIVYSRMSSSNTNLSKRQRFMSQFVQTNLCENCSRPARNHP